MTTKKDKVDSKSKNIAVLTHIGCIFFFILPPLIVYLVAEDEFVKDNAKEALNFEISIALYSILSAILLVVLIGFIGFAIIAIANVILPIIAAISVNDGKKYEYPFIIRFLK